MAVTSSPTKDQIINQVEDIVTDGNYTANELRALLSNIVGSLYSPFYSATSNPSTSNNQTQNYKTGSLGKNSSTGRYFVCSSATASAATWEQISLDKGYQTISATSGGTFQINNNTSIVNFAGSQNGVTVNLPTAANSYTGKVVRVNFMSPAQTSGSGVTFNVPEVSPYVPGSIAQNLYTSNAFVEFTYSGATWALTQYVPTVLDSGFQTASMTEGGSVSLSKDTAIHRITKSPLGPATVTAYTVLLPADPYAGKVVKIMTQGSPLVTITTLTVQTPAAVTIDSGTLNANEAVEFVYNGTSWTKVAPTIIW